MLSLFAMCTAPALIPIFLGMTEHMTEARRKRTAFGVALTVTLALAFMIFFGEKLFRLMGKNSGHFSRLFKSGYPWFSMPIGLPAIWILSYGLV